MTDPIDDLTEDAAPDVKNDPIHEAEDDPAADHTPTEAD